MFNNAYILLTYGFCEMSQWDQSEKLKSFTFGTCFKCGGVLNADNMFAGGTSSKMLGCS